MKYVVNVFRLIAVVIASAYSSFTGFIVLLFTRSTDRCINTAVQMFSRSVFFISHTQYKSYDGEKIDTSEAKIFVSNHESHFDPPAVTLGCPVPLYFLAKKELKYVPFIGWYIWLSGMIFIDRKNRAKSTESLRLAGEKVKKGKNIISFAEGTRSEPGELLKFKRGAFRMSREHGIDIVPVGILGSGDVLPTGSSLIKPGEISVKYGSVMKHKDYSHLSIDEYAEACRQEVRKLIEELKVMRSDEQ